MSDNATRALPGWPPVVVAGGYLTGIVLMRNLARRGVHVSCIDFTPTQPAFRTVYGKAHLCPNPDTHPSEWVKFMIDLAGTMEGKPVLIPSADQFVTAIGEHASELKGHYTFCLSSAETQALLATKQRQYDIAGRHGLPVPRTAFVQSLEETAALFRRCSIPLPLETYPLS